jgi:hypothetical protein
MEANFHSVEVEGTNFPELSDIIDKFADFHSARGKPSGDSLESQMDILLFETCAHFGIQYVSLPHDTYIFLPLDMDRDQVKEMVINHNNS